MGHNQNFNDLSSNTEDTSEVGAIKEQHHDPHKDTYLKLDEKIHMRPTTHNDAESLYELVRSNKKYLAQWVDWAKADFDRDKADEWIKKGIENRRSGKKLDMGIFDDDRYIGHVTLFNLDSSDKDSEIGYWLAEDIQGQGVATKACRALLQFAFSNLGISRVVLHTAASNPASNRVAEKLGFEFVGADDNGLGESVNRYVKERKFIE